MVRAELYVTRGREAGKALELSPGSVVSFGRALANDVRIRDAQVSRVHCRFECTEDGVRLKDVSGNGTFVEDDRIRGVEVTLKDGDTIRLGGTVIRVLIETDEEAREHALLTEERDEPSEDSPPHLSESTTDDLTRSAARTLGQPKITLAELSELKKARSRRADIPPTSVEKIEPLDDEEPLEDRPTAAGDEEELAAAESAARRPSTDDANEPLLDESAPDESAPDESPPEEDREEASPVESDETSETEGLPVLRPLPAQAPRATPRKAPLPTEPSGHLREVIPGYRIEAKLGGGGRRGTVVYRAIQLSLDRPVALKVLLPNAAASERDLARFLREAAAIARLPHPNIVTVHDAGKAAERRFIVMELLPGGSAADRIEDQGKLPLDEALVLALDVSRGLAFAHDRGIVHRSIRPVNVLRDALGGWKLVDFGLARDVMRAGGGETNFIDAPLEAIAYLSPEQIESSAVDARSDVYSTGSLLYHALTGKPPFWGDSIATIAGRIGSEPPLEPLAANAPASLANVVRRCLAADPAARYPDGQTLLHELIASQSAIRTGRPARTTKA